jgi:subtilisin-like proprotein convertase family protein
MKRPTRIALGLAVTAVLFAFLSNFTQRASTRGRDAEQQAPTAASKAGYRSPGEQHKVLVSDLKLGQTLQSQGGKLIADYGSYVLLELNSAAAQQLADNQAAEIVDENNLILLNAGAIDTSTGAVKSKRPTVNGVDGKQMRLIQFLGPIRGEWYQALVATGARIVTYIPNNAYLVYGDAQKLQAVHELAANPAIAQWDGDYTAQFRIDPAINATGKEKAASKKGLANLSANGNEQFTIQLVDDSAENAKTLALIEQFKLEPIIQQDSMLGYVNIKVALPRYAVINQIAGRGDVVSIQQWITPVKLDERQDIIITGNVSGTPAIPVPGDYLAYLAGKGFTFSSPTSFAVNISDSGIDNATQTPNHFALYTLGDPSTPSNSRIIYNRLLGTPNAGSTLQGCDGHGNLNTHIIGGYVPNSLIGTFPHSDAAGFRWGLGVMPNVKIGSSVIFDPDTFTSPPYETLESQAYRDGARISSNSWGSSDNTYTTDSQRYDALVRDAQPDSGCALPCVSVPGNQEYVIVFAAGNGGSGANTVGSPSTGKNLITVGAAENVNPFSGADGCGIADIGADNANDIISFSSRGPTSDGRKKPDIVAPGTHVSGGVAQAALVLPGGSGTGAQLACFDGGGVCGGVDSIFFPAGQEYYSASSGTSHSTPAIAGAAALIRQHFINQSLAPPTPAMTKALLLNSARYLNGTGANDSLPSNSQGMGEISLNNYFDIFTTPSIRRDQVAADKFTASGQQRVLTGTISNNTKPFRVTVAWTDPPGPTSGNAFINNLDLQVTVGGNTYKGNVFSGAVSAPGGTADTRNNVETVIVPAGVTGSFVVKIIATNIAGNGVPGDADPLDQDYALVVYNGVEAALIPVVGTGTAIVTAESCAPANTAPDPGETVTFNFSLSNVGTANTTNLVGTLQSTGGVTSPSGPQNYGAIMTGGAPVSRPFTFTANPSLTCGDMILATLQLQDGATNLGNVTFAIRVGRTSAGSVTASYVAASLPIPLPDVTITNIPFAITDIGLVADVNVKIRLNHTFDGDLAISLISPDGTTVPLSTRRGSSGDDFGIGANDCSGTPTIFDDAAIPLISGGSAPFSGSFKPESPLSAFNGQNTNGTWILRIEDLGEGDSGTLGCATLEISRNLFNCCGVPGTPIVSSGGAATITAESVSPGNNAPDPEETVTANFPLINNGTGPTTNLVATMQTSGGIRPVTPTANYGAVAETGTPVSRPFTFVASGACGSIVTVTLQLQDGPVALGTATYTFTLGTIPGSPVNFTFSNTTTITIPASGTGTTTGAPATPYPSNIIVTGAPTTIDKVTVSLNNFNHTFPDDVDVLLVSPTGRKLIIFSDSGSLTVATNLNITLDDAAASQPPDGTGLTSGTFRPANYGTVQDPFPAPAPAGPYLSPAPGGTDTLNSAFAGAAGGNPNGTWSLYVVDDASGDVGNFNSGWTLTLTQNPTPVCNTQACTLNVPANITVPKDALTCAAVVNYNATFTGTCGVVTVTPQSGSLFGIGTTTVNVVGTKSDNSTTTNSFTVTVTDSETLPTGSGTNVLLNFCNTTVNFASILNAGNTTVINAPPQTLPLPYTACTGCPQLNISTTAVPAPSSQITTCITLPNTIPADGTFLRKRLLHSESGVLVNRTSTINAATRTICAATTSLSPFVVVVDPTPTAAPTSISGSVTTSDGTPLSGVAMRLTGAVSARTITDCNGNYHFDNVDTGNFYSITPALVNYGFTPVNRSFSLNGSKTDAVFTALPAAFASSNAIDSAEYFVRQQYVDFLGREPDQGGFEYWTQQLEQCEGDASCIRARRLDVSAAFFAEREFQETGSFIVRLYNSTLARQLGYSEFSADRQHVVAGPNLEAGKAAFANAFVQRAEFLQKYQNNNSDASFVDALLNTMRDSAGLDLSSERINLINKYNSGGSVTESRASVVRDLADNAVVMQRLYNGSFVLMEYFGYLKRDPDQGGYDYWLNVLNNHEQGNYRGMVCAFITSTEYQRRFGSLVSRSNADCGR